MTSVHSINFPQARLTAGGYFGLIQASQNTLQIKEATEHKAYDTSNGGGNIFSAEAVEERKAHSLFGE